MPEMLSETMPNQEMLDATQDAVLSAASSVASVIETTAQELSGHGTEAFYLEAEFWVGLAFVLAIVGLFKPAVSALKKMLQARSETIALRLKEAVDLKEDAQKLLAEYERKFRGAEKEASEILARSEREIEAIKKETFNRLDMEMEIREREAKARLKAAESQASKEIVSQTTDLTLDIVKKVLSERIDDKFADKLIDESIQNLKKVG